MTGEGAARAEVDRPAAGEPAFLLVLTAWGGFVQVALKDDLPQRQTWDESR